MAEIDDIRVALRLELDKFREDINRAKNAAQGMGDEIGRAAGKGGAGLLGMIRSAAGLAGIGLSIGFVIHQMREGERSTLRLEQSIRGLGRGGSELIETYKQLALAIGKEGIIPAAQIRAGTAALANFTTISNEDLPKAVKVMANLAAVTGSTEGAARLLGRASDGGGESLRRYGIRISNAALESGDFSRILDEISRSVEGLNKKMAEQPTGGLDQLQNAFADLAEEAGKLAAIPLVPVMQGWKLIFEGVADAVNEARSDAALLFEEASKAEGLWQKMQLYAAGGVGRFIPGAFAAEASAAAEAIRDRKKSSRTAGAAGAEVAVGGTGEMASGAAARSPDVALAKQLSLQLSLSAAIAQQRKDATALYDRISKSNSEEDKARFTKNDLGSYLSKLDRQYRDAVDSMFNGIRDEAASLEAEMTGDVEQQANARMAIREREYGLAREKMVLDVGISKEKVKAFDEEQSRLMAGLELQKKYAVEDKRIQTEAEYVGLLQQVRSEEASLSDDFQEAAKLRYDARMDEIKLTEEQIWLELEFGKISGENASKKFEAQERLKELADQRRRKESRTPLQELADDWADTEKQMNAATVRWAQNSSEAIINFVKTGKFEFKSFAASVIEDLFRIQVQQALLGDTKGSIGGIFGTIMKFWSGGGAAADSAAAGATGVMAANGGEAPMNRISLVGERGPELIAPKTAMMVTPLSQMTGGKSGPTVVVNNNNNFSLGVQQTVRAEIVSLIPQITETSKRSVLSAINKGGAYTTAVGR